MLSDAVKIRVGDVFYQDWTDVDVDSDVFTPADSFSVRGKLPPKEIAQYFREGVRVDVYLGDDRQMTGVIDAVNQSGSKEQTRISISGRDLGAYLLDTEAEAINAKGYTVKTLIEKLVNPAWGFRGVVLNDNDDRKLKQGREARKKAQAPHELFGPIPRSSTKVDPGQKIAQILDQHTRRLGVTWWVTADGHIYIGKPNYRQAPSYTFQAASLESGQSQGNNVEAWSVDRSISERYSDLIIAAMGIGSVAKLFTDKQAAAKFSATEHDPDLVARGISRKLIVTDSDVLNAKMAQDRAKYEMGRRRLSAMTIHLTVPGFRQNGLAFTANTIARVRIDEASINGDFWVSQRRFTRSKQKDRTELTLHQKGVYLA